LDALHEGAPVSAPQADFEKVRQAVDSLRDAVRQGAAGRGRRHDWPLLSAIAGLAVLIVAMQLHVIDRRPAEQPGPVPAPVATAAAVQSVAGGIERLAGRLGVIEGRLDALAAERAKTFERASTAGGRASDIAERVRGIEDELARLSATVAPVAQEAPAKEAAAPVEKAPEPAFHHHLRRGETLWSVAERYYGRGQLYPVLIANNPGLGPYHRGVGILRIFADPDEAAEMYRRITPPGEEGRLFRYRVEPGDGWRELARRFLGRPSRAPELIALNPESDLTPGEQVLIALE
jgi:nucleoid-associated protein YgaU